MNGVDDNSTDAEDELRFDSVPNDATEGKYVELFIASYNENY